MDELRFGLIGYGAWGAHHARVLAECPSARLQAVAVPSAESQARAAAAHPEVRTYADCRAMLHDEPLDAVAVGVPTDLHAESARAVLESGRHLLLEKPMAPRLDQCDDLIRLAAARGRVLAVGHEMRLSALWGRVKVMVDAGAIGAPHHAMIEPWRNPYRLGSGGWRYDPARVGNWALEEPIHFFVLARWYFSAAGKPTSVVASASARRPDRPGLSDNFTAIVHFPGGAYAIVSHTLAGWEHHQLVKLTGPKVRSGRVGAGPWTAPSRPPSGSSTTTAGSSMTCRSRGPRARSTSWPTRRANSPSRSAQALRPPPPATTADGRSPSA
jgi:myo-inositol 2-dehydrogenase/D-chiro-inositol 1-dehydrogenase